MRLWLTLLLFAAPVWPCFASSAAGYAMGFASAAAAMAGGKPQMATIGPLVARPTSAPIHNVVPRPTIVRLGDHLSFGRVVFLLSPDLPPGAVPRSTRNKDIFILDLPGAGEIVSPPRGAAARHVLSVSGGHERATLALEPGSTTRLWRAGNRLVVDVFGPDPVQAAPAPGVRTGGVRGPEQKFAGGVASTLDRNGAGRTGIDRDAPVRNAPDSNAPNRNAPTGNSADHHVRGPRAAGEPRHVEIAPRPNIHAADVPGTTPALAHHPAAIQTAGSKPVLPAPAAAVAQDAVAPPDDQDGSSASTSLAASMPAVEPAGTSALRAVRTPGGADAILLPFDPQVGAAAFPRGGLGHVLFDDSKAIDLAALKGDPVFGSARITLLPGSTQLTMPLPSGAQLALSRQPQGWLVTVQRGREPGEVASARLHDGVLSVGARQAGSTVVLIDADTGAKLLVGTVHTHGAAVAVPHASPEFTLLPSWEGVVAEVSSDRLTLTSSKEGFALRAATGPALSAVMGDATQHALESADGLTKHFDIPPLAAPALLRRLDSDIADAAAAPKQARFVPRLRAAEDMLGLGMDREAAALLQAARQDDPSQENRPEAAALLSVARWLAGQNGAADEAAALGKPGLGASDEVALWRALAPPLPMAMVERAAVIAADWRLLLGYPEPLRRRLMPLAAAILIDGHQAKAAQDLLATSDDPVLGAAKARLLQDQGRTADALLMLDAVGDGPDRKGGAQAITDAIELRLRTKRIGPAQAAAALMKQVYHWREPAFEIATRLRAADLLVQAGDFRGALAHMREVDALFPDAHDRVHAAEQGAVQALVQAGAGARVAAVDLVALVDENTDLLGERGVAAVLTPVLVDKLMALDLPERAAKLVAKLMDSTADPEAKASLGSRLAGLRLDQGDAAGTMAALDQSGADDLSPPLLEMRVVQRARALVLQGQPDDAVRLLADRHGDAALELQSQLLERARDWRGAETTLQALVQSRVPGQGALSESQQDLVLRLASAASQAGDAAELRLLQTGSASRLNSGSRASLFQALAVQPVEGIADLPRSGREAKAARELPAALASYRAN